MMVPSLEIPVKWRALSVLLILAPVAPAAFAAELTLEAVVRAKGDGPDGVGNTDDDTWQFWFELAHAPGSFRLLTRHSSTVPAKGIPGKVSGPVAGALPNPAETEGWVLHTDWDGRYEGIWGDGKAKEILVHPYVEKTAHMAVAVSYKIPEDGVFVISAGLTDVQVNPNHPKHDGVIWKLEAVEPGAGKTAELMKGEPFGDGHGRPDSARFKSKKIKLRNGYLVRLVIHPNKWWGQDLTRIDFFRIEKQ